ncbi:hypothetical protein Tco_0349937 [Tanacetum coccineum]
MVLQKMKSSSKTFEHSSSSLGPDQASVFMEMTFEQRSSSLVLHQMTSVANNSSGLAPPRQMTSDHNSSELGIHVHSNELSRSKL